MIDVAVAILAKAGGSTITVQRRKMTCPRFPGWRELPGGKRDPGESLLEALARELSEELGITIQTANIKQEPLCAIEFDYSREVPFLKKCRIHFYLVTAWQKEAWGREGQLIEEIPLDALIDDPELIPLNRAALLIYRQHSLFC